MFHLVFGLDDIVALICLGLILLIVAGCWIWVGIYKISDWFKKKFKKPGKDDEGRPSEDVDI